MRTGGMSALDLADNRGIVQELVVLGAEGTALTGHVAILL